MLNPKLRSMLKLNTAGLHQAWKAAVEEVSYIYDRLSRPMTDAEWEEAQRLTQEIEEKVGQLALLGDPGAAEEEIHRWVKTWLDLLEKIDPS